MTMIIKPVANQMSLTAQNTVSNSMLVFLSTTASSQVNVYSNSSTQYGSFVLPGNTVIFLQKATTDLVSSNVTVYATPAAYKS